MRIAIVTETFLPKIDGIVTMVTKTVETLRAGGVVWGEGGEPAVDSVSGLSGAARGGTAGFDAEAPGGISTRRISSVRAIAAGDRRDLLREGAKRPDCDFV